MRTVSLYLQRTAQQGLGWPLPAELDDAALEARLYPRATALRNRLEKPAREPTSGPDIGDRASLVQ